MIMIPFAENSDQIDLSNKAQWEEISEGESDLIESAEKGDAEAQRRLGYYYRHRAEQKLELFRSLPSGSRHMRAPYDIGERNPITDSAIEDRKTAFEYFQKAAEQGNVDSIYQLGICYLHGEGTHKFLEKAREYLENAAEKGHAEAQYDLGMLCLSGEKDCSVFFPKDNSLAVKWLTRAAEQGDSLAQFHLAECYEKGTGVKQSDKEALFRYKRAAESECPLAWAVCKAGEFYEFGRGTDRDEARAAELYRKAAELGDTAGMYNLGRCYEEGIGVEKDLGRAIEWYEAASNEGDEQAFDALDRLRE